MVTQTVAPDPSAVRLIQIPGSEVLPQIQPTIAIGELLRFVVRDNQNGQGQLYLRGTLIPATLPPGAEVGDKILAKVTESTTNQLVLRIVDTEKSQLTAGAQKADAPGLGGADIAARKIVASLLQEFLRSPDAAGFAGPEPLPLAPETLAALVKDATNAAPRGEARDAAAKIELLTQMLPKSAELLDARTTEAKLSATVDGTLATALRDAAKALRSVAPETPRGTSERFLAALSTELSGLLASSADDNFAAKSHLDAIVAAVTDELVSTNRKLSTKDREDRSVLKSALVDLSRAQEQSEGLSQHLEAALRRVQSAAPQRLDRALPLDGKASEELKMLASKLDQMAATQERLNKLNPLMQALGEPAMILFPFLAQGLLKHSEVIVEPRKGKRRGEDEEGEGGQKRGGEEAAPFQRIQVSVPLPSIGIVDVDVAHRESEILVRFSVEDPEVGAFLQEQLEHLATILRERNFKRAELVAHVGPRNREQPAWTISLGSANQVVA